MYAIRGTTSPVPSSRNPTCLAPARPCQPEGQTHPRACLHSTCHIGAMTPIPSAWAPSAKRRSYVTSPSSSSPSSSAAARCSASRLRSRWSSNMAARSHTAVESVTRIRESRTARACTICSGAVLRVARNSSARRRSLEAISPSRDANHLRSAFEPLSTTTNFTAADVSR